MIKYSTPNDLLRLFRKEETEEGNLFKLAEFDLTESLGLLKDVLDGLRTEPADDCVRKVLEYSRSTEPR